MITLYRCGKAVAQFREVIYHFRALDPRKIRGTSSSRSDLDSHKLAHIEERLDYGLE